jgi:hypothetical protein
LANALVQVGPAGSKTVAITGTNGSYTVSVGAGTYELYADAAGYSANTQSITLTTDTTKNITLTAAAEPEGLSANFDANANGWEIATYDTNWVATGTAVPAVRDTTQNWTPGGSGSALIEDKIVVGSDGTTQMPAAYRVMQRAASQRIAVQAGKAYNVYFRVKAENWVTVEHRDAVHYQLVWRNAAGDTVGTVYSHPHWIYPQSYWYIADRGHPAGTDDSVALARMVPPAGAASLDLRIGWLRSQSEINTDTATDGNPPGSLLYVDDVVVDAVGSAVTTPTIALSRTNGQIAITYTGTLESTTDITKGWATVQGATSPYTVTASGANSFYRSRQ